MSFCKLPLHATSNWGTRSKKALFDFQRNPEAKLITLFAPVWGFNLTSDDVDGFSNIVPSLHPWSKSYWCSFCGLVYDLFWKMFHVHLRRVCILLLLGVEFCSCLLGPSVLMCCSMPLPPYLFSCLVDLSVGVRCVLKSPIFLFNC